MELFENVPVWKAYFTISLPVVFSMVVTLVYNMVDTFFVAGTQNARLVAGVSQCTPLFILSLTPSNIIRTEGLAMQSMIASVAGSILTTCFIAMGKAVPSFVLSISRQGVIFTVVILITAACFGYDGIICAQPVADFLTAVVGIFMYAAARKSDQTLRRED